MRALITDITGFVGSRLPIGEGNLLPPRSPYAVSTGAQDLTGCQYVRERVRRALR